MGDSLKIGDFGRIMFYMNRKDCIVDKNGKLTHVIIGDPCTYEGMEVTDADRSRIWIEGTDRVEVFNIRRSDVISFEKMDKPK